MKLRRIQVTNFRAVEDSTPFTIGQITCLVGKNESGKTTLLQALERLNPVEATRKKYNKLIDYPRRHLANYASRHPQGEARVLRTEWELEADERIALEEEFGADCLIAGKPLVLTKDYEQDGSDWSVPLDEGKALQHLTMQAGLNATERRAIEKYGTSKELHGHLTALAEKTPAKEALLKRIGAYRDQSISLKAADILKDYEPEFVYFSNYSKMEGDVSIEAIQGKLQSNPKQALPEGEQVFLAFLEYAGTNINELATARRYEELNARCEAASNKITDQIFEYWSQNRHLSVGFEVQAGKPDDPAPFNSGNVMHARVKNELHRILVPFSERSAGFIWFFSFLVYFSQIKKTHGNVVILLDEPGLNLHGTAQLDLLRFIREKLAPDHQVLYTTHSPFMVPADDLASVRTVEDVVRYDPRRPAGRPEVLGTKVGDDVLSTDRETLFPLQGALGYEITQSLFIGEHTLLVEGPSDILYLQAASVALKERGRTFLDPRWVICPSGGLDKVNAFLSLFGGNGLHVAVLSDFAKGQKGTVERLRRSELLKSGHVFTMADFCGQEEADVEDLLAPELFVELINSTYSLPDPQKLSVDKLIAADPSTVRNVKKAEAYFRSLPPDAPEFSHYIPAFWLIQNSKFLIKKTKHIDTTLDRFEQVFEAINKLI